MKKRLLKCAIVALGQFGSVRPPHGRRLPRVYFDGKTCPTACFLWQSKRRAHYMCTYSTWPIESLRRWTERGAVQMTAGPGSILGCGVVLSVVHSRLQWLKSLKLWLYNHKLLILDEQREMKYYFLTNKLVCDSIFSDAKFSLCVIANGCFVCFEEIHLILEMHWRTRWQIRSLKPSYIFGL